QRHLPTGSLRVDELQLLAAAGAVLMFIAAAMLNSLCLALAPLALAFLIGYSYTKRFTWTSHWILGFTDGIAAAGGWIAVRGAFDAPAIILWFALTVWIAGFDLIYACQDVEVDRAQGLHSVPARFGIAAPVRVAPSVSKPEAVRAMFTRIAQPYDLMNSLMTAGRHHAWRAVVARAAAAAPPGPALDLATGTADLALALRALDPTRL